MKIKGYQNYEVRPNGEVVNVKTGRILKKNKTKKGYLTIMLYTNGNGKRCFIHRLVAEAFIPNPQNLPEVNHKDEDKTNNCVSNLEWCTRKYNVNYGTGIERMVNKMSKTVLQLRMDGSLVRVWPSTMEVQRQLHFNNTSISQCCNGKRHSTYGYKWCYAS